MKFGIYLNRKPDPGLSIIGFMAELLKKVNENGGKKYHGFAFEREREWGEGEKA
jgi:hypothetical protein